MPTSNGLKMFTRVTITTFFPDGTLHRRNYKPPVGAYLTREHFDQCLAEHRRLNEQYFPEVTFREVKTGPNTWSFIHPERDRDKSGYLKTA